MPLLPNTSASDITLRKQTRAIYADYIVQKQKVAQGCATRVQITGGSAATGTMASDFTLLKEGEVLTTPAEQAAILAENACPLKYVYKLFYAIPDFTYTTNTITVLGEPGTWQCVASDLSNNIMNGTYLTTGSHFFVGDMNSGTNGAINSSGTLRCFRRIQPTDASGGWLTRTASNNYAANGNYQGNTNTTISGSTVAGEYMTITAPYSFVLNSYNLVTGHRGIDVRSWVIGGSTDGGATWTTVDTQTDVTITNHTVTIQLLSNTTSYSSYIIVVTKNISSGGANGANIDSFNLFTKLAVAV
jgi:hypothetical protein